jgi:hypothetical protein
MEQPLGHREARSGQRIILWLAIGFGLLAGFLAGGGVVFHDGKSWMEGALVGLGFFVLGFALMYLRFGRRIAELLSLIR